jgi:CheY-like chemotaxis protein
MPHSAYAVQASILVIENQDDVLADLARILAGAGYRCHCSTSAAAARQLAGEVRPDLIISDINLAGASGPALCDEIKHQPGLAAVRVMYLSGGQLPDIIRRADDSGSAYYVRKPFDAHVILELIEQMLHLPATAGH